MKKADLKLWLWCLTATSLPCTLFAQQAPVPDPISTPAATVEKQKCKCDLKALTADELASVGPVSSFGDDTKSVMSPSGFTRPNPKDEWSGEDELYRVSWVGAREDDNGQLKSHLDLRQIFEIYNGTPGTDSGFELDHTHPNATHIHVFEWKTNNPQNPADESDVGMILNGEVVAHGITQVSGSVVAASFQLGFIPVFDGFHADAGVSTSMSINVTFPTVLAECNGADKEIKLSVGAAGSVSTSQTGSTSVTLTGNGTDKQTTKESGSTFAGGVSAGVTGSATITDTAFSGEATFVETMPILGETNENSVRIPVSLVGAVSGSGTADEAYARGSASAKCTVVWNGTVKPCAMLKPEGSDPSTEPGDPGDEYPVVADAESTISSIF